MQLDDTSRRVIDQFLQARLQSAQAALEASRQLDDGTLSAQATESFMLVASLLRRWHDLGLTEVRGREHRGVLLLDYFTSSSQFTLRRSKKLPLLLGDELRQTTLVRDLWDEFFFTIRLIPLKIEQRGDRLIFRFDYRRLPTSYHQIFSRRNPTSWLLQSLTLESLNAWIRYQELVQVGIQPTSSANQPHRFSLSFRIVTQLALPLE